MEAYAMFYIHLQLVIVVKMNHHSCGHSAVLKGDVQTLGLQELYSNVLKSALLHRHELYVPKLVLAYCVELEPKRPCATDGAVAQELRRYQVTVD